MKHVLTLSLLVLFAATAVSAQSVDELVIEARNNIQQAYIHGDADGLRQAGAALERVVQADKSHAYAHYYLGLYYYRLVPTMPEKDQPKYLDEGILWLEKALKINADFAEAEALLSSMFGWKAGLRPMQAMIAGPKANRYIASAKAKDPDNPRIVLIGAVSDFNTPPMFGGDKERAMEGFVRATELFAAQEPAEGLSPSWGAEDAFAWLGQVRMQNGDLDGAQAAFDQALAISPEFGWVKYGLMPALEKQKADSK